MGELGSSRVKRKMLKLVLVVILGVLPSGLADCPDGWTANGEYCYAYMQGRTTWPDAASTCAAVHGHLPEVYSQDEWDFLTNFSAAMGKDDQGQLHDIWLGGHDLVTEGVWTWAFSGSPVTFAPWGPGQPNDHGDENCMVLHDEDWTLNDGHCNSHTHFVCQKSGTNDVAIG